MLVHIAINKSQDPDLEVDIWNRTIWKFEYGSGQKSSVTVGVTAYYYRIIINQSLF
jgi:hypothetical protein